VKKQEAERLNEQASKAEEEVQSFCIRYKETEVAI